MDNAHTFARYWSGQVPFIASFVLQQLRLYVAQNVWFNGHDQSRWFDVPVGALEQLQDGYQQQDRAGPANADLPAVRIQ